MKRGDDCDIIGTRPPRKPDTADLPLFQQPEPVKAARRDTQDAVARAGLHASIRWHENALAAVRLCADTMREGFTTEDVWAVLEQSGRDVIESERNPKALGAVMQTAKRKGIIRHDGEFRENPRRHMTPCRVWRAA